MCSLLGRHVLGTRSGYASVDLAGYRSDAGNVLRPGLLVGAECVLVSPIVEVLSHSFVSRYTGVGQRVVVLYRRLWRLQGRQHRFFVLTMAEPHVLVYARYCCFPSHWLPSRTPGNALRLGSWCGTVAEVDARPNVL